MAYQELKLINTNDILDECRNDAAKLKANLMNRLYQAGVPAIRPRTPVCQRPRVPSLPWPLRCRLQSSPCLPCRRRKKPRAGLKSTSRSINDNRLRIPSCLLNPAPVRRAQQVLRLAQRPKATARKPLPC